MGTGAFQRARRPDQVRARREAIVSAARQLLGERGVADVSLRELSERIGLAKSNVLRYFDSREAIFLEILDQEWAAWTASVTDALTAVPPAAGAPYARELAVGRVLAESLAARPLLCELLSAMAGVLERNVGLEFARTFKQHVTGHSARLADLVRRTCPELTEADARHFVSASVVLLAGLWPHVHPTEAIATVAAELGYPPMADRFADDLTEAFTNQLVGLVTRRRALG